MLTGVSKEKAIKALSNGKQVLVCDRSIRNGKVIPMVSLDNYLDGLDFLMDVPAVSNPEFEEAVQSMVDSGETKEESEKQEEVIPPPNQAGVRNDSGREEQERDCAGAGGAGTYRSGNCKKDRD